MTQLHQYSAKLAQTRQNDAEHDKLMTAVAERGGITLDKLRAMSMNDKDEFITKWSVEK